MLTTNGLNRLSKVNTGDEFSFKSWILLYIPLSRSVPSWVRRVLYHPSRPCWSWLWIDFIWSGDLCAVHKRRQLYHIAMPHSSQITQIAAVWRSPTSLNLCATAASRLQGPSRNTSAEQNPSSFCTAVDWCSFKFWMTGTCVDKLRQKIIRFQKCLTDLLIYGL